MPFRRALRLFAVIAIWLACILSGTARAQSDSRDADFASSPTHKAKFIILGIDGLGLESIQNGIEEGALPNFRRLRDQGALRTIPAAIPAVPHVAWADVDAGAGPGAHGVFGAVRMAPDRPVAVNATVEFPVGQYREDGVFIEGAPVSLRDGKTFWEKLDEAGVRVTALFEPLGFPPPALKNGRVLAGLNTPDLRLGAAPYAIYTTGSISGTESSAIRHYPLPFAGNLADTALEGPWIPEIRALWNDLNANAEREAGAVARAATPEQRAAAQSRLESVRVQLQALAPRRFALAPFQVERLPFAMGVQIDLQGQRQVLARGAWSAPFDARFDLGHGRGARGLMRFYLIPSQGDEDESSVHLLASAIEMHPAEPWLPIASPPEFGAELFASIGPFRTQGWPWMTAPLLDERISDAAFLDDFFSILDERERIFDTLLNRDDWDCFYAVFPDCSIIQSLFRRAVDPRHPRFRKTGAAEGANAIARTIQRMDGLVGRALDALAPDGRLIVLSTAGTAPYYASVNLNNILLEAGLLKTLNPSIAPDSVVWPGGVNWQATQAFALGYGQVFVNRRTGFGDNAKSAQEIQNAKRAAAEAFLAYHDPRTNEPIVSAVYDAAQLNQGTRAGAGPDLIVGLRPGYRVDPGSIGGGLSEKAVQANNSRWSADSASLDPAAVPGLLGANWAPTSDAITLIDIAPMVLDFFGLSEKKESGTSLPPIHPE